MKTKRLFSLSVVFFLVCSIWWAYSSLWAIDPPSDDIGMAILYGFLSIPIAPFTHGVALLLDAFTLNYNKYYFYTLYGLSTYLKFLVVIVLSTISFGLGYIFVAITALLEKSFLELNQMLFT